MNDTSVKAAEITVGTPVSSEAPGEILKKIRNAWIAGIISGCITLAITILAMTGTRVLNFSAWELIDVALIFGLTFGIYKKSRTCAVLMLVYFVISKIMIMMETGKPNGIVLAVIFIYYYFQGMVGTFQYHKFLSGIKTSAANA